MNLPQFKHQQVEAEIRRMAQTLPIGSRLPAERSMAQSYGCNFLTVRRALKALVDDGTVVRKIGSGTFVARHEQVDVRVATNRIGVLICQRADAYAYRVLQAVAQGAAGQDVEIRSSWVRDFQRDGVEQARSLAQEGCVGLLLPWFPHDQTVDVREFVRASELPVALPMLIPGLEKQCFERQEVFGGSLQTAAEALCAYFHTLGHRRIAFLGPDVPSDVVLQKVLSSYVCYTSRANLANHCGLVRPGAAAMDQVAERWQEYRGDLAVICYDDEHALRFMTAMHKLGLSAPGDFVVAGYNDTEASQFSDPPLTTISQNFEYIGEWLVRSARALSRGELDQSDAPPRPRLLVRQSCGGVERIDETFRLSLPQMDIVVDVEQAHGVEV